MSRPYKIISGGGAGRAIVVDRATGAHLGETNRVERHYNIHPRPVTSVRYGARTFNAGNYVGQRLGDFAKRGDAVEAIWTATREAAALAVHREAAR